MVRFTDKPDCFALRQQHLAAHIAWLDQHRDVVLVGGSLRVEPADAPVGGLWIVEAHSRAEILQLMASDPFTLCGLRDDVEILYWSKAFSERKTLV